jgi:cytochrome c oxidase subunit 2
MMNLLAQTETFFLPTQGANLSYQYDWAWNVVLGITGFFFCLVVLIMLVFIFKYRRRTPNDATPEITHNTPLEITWTVVPLIIVMGIFFVGFKGFINYDTPPSNAVVVDVEAKKWSFQFTYPNGGISDTLYVQKGVPVVLNLHSVDVLHALYIPAFRTQRNAIPYRTTNIWFIPEELTPPDGFPIFCTQYCGKDHSHMHTAVHVLDAADFQAAMAQVANPFKVKDANGHEHWVPYVQLGEKFYNQMGCATCHNVTGAPGGTGPTWKGLWKSDVTFSASNVPGFAMHAADSDQQWEDYITDSALHPSAKIVSGYQDQMPSFEAQFSGSPAKEEKLRAIITYIRSIGKLPFTPPIPENSDLYDADKHPDHHPEWLQSHWPAANGGTTAPAAATTQAQ